MTAVPDAAAVAEYLGNGAAPEELEDALAAETALQAAACRVDTYNPALAAALCRRVARHLSMKNLVHGVEMDEVGMAQRIGSTDPEVRRLEAPYRRLAVG